MTVTAEAGGKSASVDVTVTVTGVNEPPTVTGELAKNYAENGTDAVATYTASDPESDSITWSVSGTDEGDFEISTGGVLSFASSPNYESPADSDTNNTYSVTVEASDGNSNTGTLDVIVTVTNVNEKPVVSGSASVNKAEGADKTVGTYTATDPDAGASVTWTLSGTDAADFDISTGGVLSFAQAPDLENPLDSDTDNEYSVTVKASDGSLEDTLDVTVTVSGVNESPSITGGPMALNYAENDSAPVGTYTATDPEDDSITWSLSGTDSADFSISTGGVLTFASSPDFEVPVDADTNNVYSVTVRASDGNTTVTRDVIVTVTGVNEAPVISGDATKNYAENGSGAVASYTATDPESDSFTWSVSGTDAADFSITSDGGVLTFASSPDFEAAADSDTNNVYSVTVEASDGNGNTGTLDVTVTVTNVNEPPVVTGDATKDYAENDTAGVATYTASDPESDTITWSVSGTDGGDFEISTGGALSFASSPDYEAAADADGNNVYLVTVEASDGNGNTGTLAVTVSVSGVNEKPVVSGSASVNKAEGADKTVGTYTATDPDAGASVTWSLSGTDEGDFDISTGGVLSFKQAPDHESPQDSDGNNVYSVTVEASDGTLDGTLDVTVTVTGVNETPTITGGPTAVASYAENGTGAVGTYTATDPEGTTIVWSVSGTDEGDFSISTAGVLTFASSPDFEAPADADTNNVYSVTVEASDGNTKATRAVTVTVTGVNEPPVISGDATKNYAENGSGAVATYTAADPESDSVTWSLSGTDAADLAISTAGVLTFASSPNFESPVDSNTNNVYSVTVEAKDSNDNTATLDVTVTVTAVNEAPVVTGVATKNYAENGTDAVATYTATDPEGDSFTWSVSGTDADDFSITASGGVLTFASSPDFEGAADSDTDNVYSVTVEAKDSNSNTGTFGVTVTVTGVDEKPVVSGSAAVTKAEGTDRTVGTYTATDPEDATISWSLTGTDNLDFSITSPGGVLSFKQDPDREDPQDANTDNVYSVTVWASDGNLRDSLAVTVTVSAVNETPSITGGPVTVADYAENGKGAVGRYTATDPESDTITWSVSGTDSADFSISTAGVLSFASPPDFEDAADSDTNNVYSVTVEASDGNTKATLDVTVTVTNVNEAPVVTGDATKNYAENGTGAVATYTASDPEGDSFTWSLSGTDAADFAISTGGELTFASSPDFEGAADSDTNNVYSVTVEASDSNDNTATLDVTVTVTNVNEPPVVSGDATKNYEENGSGAVATYTATDPESDTITWSVSGTDAADFEISTTGVLTFASSPNFESPADADTNNVYSVTVEASDSNSNTGTLAVTVTVTNVNEPPVISGDATKNYAENGTGAVATYTATDPESDTITWSLSGTDAADLAISTGGVLTFASSPNFESPVDSNTNNVYSVTVEAKDSNDNTATLDVTVTVTNVNEPPVVSGDATKNYAENGTDAVATYTASDPEGDSFTWSVSGTDAADFSITSDGGVLTFASSPDFESPADADTDNVYSVTVEAKDSNSNTGTLDVTVTVTGVNEKPVVSGSAAVTKAEGADRTVGTYTATDPDAGATLSLWLTGTDSTDFDITSPGGVLSFKQDPDREDPQDANEDNMYSVTVWASDGTLRDSLAVTVTVSAVNETPSITGGPTAVSDYAENGTGPVGTYTATDPEDDTITWSVSGTDEDDFSISTAGVLTFASSPDFEAAADSDTNNVYSVTVEASDGNTKATRDVTVTVTNVNEPPVVSGDATKNYAENGAGAVATYTATDPESDSFTWSLSGTDAADFAISTSGVLTFASSPDFEGAADADTNNVYSVTVQAKDSNDNTGTLDVTVTVTNVNEPPVVSGDATKNYAENGTDAVATYTATDPEDDTITWSLSGTDAADFDISTTGVLTFASSPNFESPADSDTNNVYSVTVEASDGNSNTGTLDVTVTVTNVNEKPVVSGSASVTKQEGADRTVGTYTATDPDAGASVTWTLSGTDAADFEISTGGVLSFAQAPDLEDPQDSDTDNEYSVTVKASDGSLEDTLDVTVTVSGVNDSPSITGGPASVSYAENDSAAVGTYTATDPEDDSITWSVSGTDAADFSITSPGGVLTFASSPDYESPADADTDNVYSVTVEASDGNTSTTRAVTVTVTGVNEPPTVSGDATQNYAENGAGAVATYTATDPESDTITWSLSGTDAADLAISTGGVLTFASSPNFESPVDSNTNNVYSVTVEATDSNGNTGTLDVTVTVTGVNEPPVVSGDAAKNYVENGTDAVASYTATDPEGDSFTWSLSGTDAADFSITSDGGVLSFASSPDYESAADADTNNVYSVTVEAKDSNNNTGTLAVTVTVTGVDEPPTLTGSASVTRTEGADRTVATYTATDPENASINWWLTGTDGSDFDITNGVLTFKQDPDREDPQDANEDNEYEVTVWASDGNLRDSLAVTVTVSEVNDPPAISGGPTDPSYAENGTVAVATYSATDPENDTITWSLSGTDAADFSITSDGGVLTFVSSPDYEDPADADGNKAYSVTVEASDGNIKATLDVTVTVTDVDEAPTVTGPDAVDFAENGTGDVATYTADDPENDAVTWSLSGTDEDAFTIGSSGVLRFNSPPDRETKSS
ncbi:MAG: Ig-like domain-containing protein [bacterium]|nr:Ig-like domain-containing protein [bacterium]